MIKKSPIILIVLILFSCTNKQKKLDVLWQKVIQSKNAEEEEEALQNFWRDFPYERIGVSIFYKKEHGDYVELEKLSEKDTVKSIKAAISIGNNGIDIIKINNKPKEAKNYFLLYRDQ